MTDDPFALPPRLATKATDDLIGTDRAHFRQIAHKLAHERDDTRRRLDAARLSVAGSGQSGLDRDTEIRRLSTTLRVLDRYDLDLCLGRMTAADGTVTYIGRLGMAAADGQRLLVDWRAPAAEPYFAATHRDPHGLISRRRYRWTAGRVSDYWDEAFTPEGLNGTAPDDESAFIVSLGAHRSERMRDVLSTIQADQHAIIRAPSRGTLVVDGGPGTGKTVVALHRAAHLLYAEPDLTDHRGGVLFVGPSPAYLDYVRDVVPNLGEDGVRMCTPAQLTPEGSDAGEETDADVARLKGRLDPIAVIDAAVGHHERVPRAPLGLASPWGDLWLDESDWSEAFAAADGPHDDARDLVWEAVCTILTDQLDPDDAPPAHVRRWLRGDEDLLRAFARAWPLLDPAGVVADLWSVPAYLRLCAPQLSPAEVALLQRAQPRAWTTSDLPLLDAAHQRIGDPERVRDEHRRAAVVASAQDQLSHVLDHLIENDDSEMQVMSILRGDDARAVLLDVDAPRSLDRDALAGPFAHIIIDEAQELTDAQWRMLVHRCPSKSFTVVGDRTQARRGFSESWQERLTRVGARDVHVVPLTINYRTPSEIMAEAEPVIRAAVPDANVPVSVRSSGIPVFYGRTEERDALLARWREGNDDGVACVVGDASFLGDERVRSLPPAAVKGLEFDFVVLIDPARFTEGVTGAVDQYVAMTRATSALAILTSGNVVT